MPRRERIFVGVIRALGQELFQTSVDGGVDAADEGAGHRGDVVHRLTGGGAVLEGAEVGVDDATIDGLGEDEGDIDVDALGDQGLDGGQAGGGGGNP